MIRYIIQNKETGKYLKRAKNGWKTVSSWVPSVNDATLITNCSAASQIASQFCNGKSYRRRSYLVNSLPVKVIEVGVLLFHADLQPFMDGVLNGNK